MIQGEKLMKKYMWMAVLCIALAAVASAQQKEEAAAPKNLRSYKVEYQLVETQDGKPVNTRHYTLLMEEEERNGYSRGSLRVGTRVPVNVGAKDGQPSVQYMDVGLNIDCKLKPRSADKISVESSLELSNFISDPMTGGNPVMRSNRGTVTSQVVVGKKTVVATYDDINSTRSTTVEVTVTPQ
jgi:hypothetical protein